MPDYAPGVPMWIDVSSPDLEKTRRFYQGLFGWESQIFEEAGGYTIFKIDGKMVAGAGPTQAPEQHPAWMQYVYSTDPAATLQKVRDAGGQVTVEPFDVMEEGTMAVFSDSTGAYCSLWKPRNHQGAEIVNQAGSFSWSELYTRDVPKAVEFYKRVFGWQVEETEMGDMGKYELFKVDDRPIAGGMDMSFLPAEIPPHWLIYFMVKNTDEAVEKAKELGGRVLDGPKPTPMGPMAVLNDSVGAALAVIQINQQS